MAIEIKSVEEFNSLVNTGDKIVIDLWAPWCAPCKALAAPFDAAVAANTDLIFAKVDVAAVPDVATQLGVRGIPTLVGYRKGELITKLAGSITNIQKVVDSVKNVT